jgi:hypothetical protein
MERLGSHVVTDPACRMPAVEPGETGLAWLRQHVARFSDGGYHTRRRGLAEQIVHEVTQAAFTVSPTVSLLRAMGMPD